MNWIVIPTDLCSNLTICLCKSVYPFRALADVKCKGRGKMKESQNANLIGAMHEDQ